MQWFKSTQSKVAFLTAIVVVLAVIIALPQPSWNLDVNVVPLALQYNSNNNNINNNNKKVQEAPLQGVVAVVTGATSGIGLGLTKVLTRLGAHVVVLGRSPTKLQKLVQDFKEQQPNVKLTTIVGDWKDLASVARAADQISSSFPRIDILVNNAGIHRGLELFDRSVTAQGHDLVFGVNYLSHFLLTEKLLPKLLKSPKPRIVQVSSTFHLAVDGSDLMPSNATTNSQPPIASHPGGSHGWIIFRTQRQYGNSKLAQILHARALQRKYPTIRGRNSTWIRSACPGWVGTNIAGETGTFSHWVLQRLGFSNQGWGLSSILDAIFTEGDGNSDGVGKQRTPTTTTPTTFTIGDFFVNTYSTKWAGELFSAFYWFLGHSWAYKLGIRDAVVYANANAILVSQKLLVYSGPTRSSQESYDTTMQDQLYKWSREAVAPWL